MTDLSGLNLIVKTEDKKIKEICPECGNRVITNSFEITCKGCGLVVGNLYQDSSYVFNDANNKNNLNKQ